MLGNWVIVISTLILFSLPSIADEKVSLLEAKLNTQLIKKTGDIEAKLLIQSTFDMPITACWSTIEAAGDAEVKINLGYSNENSKACTITALDGNRFELKLRYHFEAPTATRAYQFQFLMVSAGALPVTAIEVADNADLRFEVLGDDLLVPLSFKSIDFKSEHTQIALNTKITIESKFSSSTPLTEVYTDLVYQGCDNKWNYGAISLLEKGESSRNGNVVTVTKDWRMVDYLKIFDKEDDCIRQILLGKKVKVKNRSLQQASTKEALEKKFWIFQ